MSIKLSAQEKDEIRRLTQLANRRIRAAQRAYMKEGMDVLPQAVVGKYQVKEQWTTEKNPISRSVKFDNRQDYIKQLQFLRSFEYEKPGIKEYTLIQREKTKQGIATSLGSLPKTLENKVDKMSAPQLSKFWNTFSDKAAKLGVKYSSGDAMEQTMNEIIEEDIQQLEGE